MNKEDFNELFQKILKIVEEPRTTALCIGKIDEDGNQLPPAYPPSRKDLRKAIQIIDIVKEYLKSKGLDDVI